MTKHIAIFGGSFNPPHADHVRLLKWLAKDCSVNFSKIIVAVTDEHPFGKDLAPYEHREAMVKAMVKSLDTVLFARVVRNIEVVRQTEPYTVDFLTRLHTEVVSQTEEYTEVGIQQPVETDTEFHLVVGTDILNDTTKWERWDDVLALATLLPIVRKGEPVPEGYDWHEVASRGYSSTDVRVRLAISDLTHPHGDGGMLSGKVLQYIRDNGLYGWQEPEFPEQEISLDTVVIPLTDLDKFIDESNSFALRGPICRVLRVSAAVDDENNPAVRFHVVRDTGRFKEHQKDIERWIAAQTRAWAAGEAFDVPKPGPTSPALIGLKVGGTYKGSLPSNAITLAGHPGHLYEYEYEFFELPGGHSLFGDLFGGLF
jgi:nicotinate-nucleotide adenylyltransferase